MKKTTTIAARIRQHIESMRPGEPFTPGNLQMFGTRAAVDQTLYRLAKAGTISRLARGVFVRPEISRFVGQVTPAPAKIAELIAKSTGATIRVTGAEAARRFEFTTQVPTQVGYCTTGPSKRLRIGKLEFRLQHVCARKMLLAERQAGVALAALWYLGKSEVTAASFETIRSKLPAVEFEALKAASGSMPSWMANALYAHEKLALRA
jgi:hypothetical protein